MVPALTLVRSRLPQERALQFDVNGDGSLDFEEFYTLWTTEVQWTPRHAMHVRFNFLRCVWFSYDGR